MTIDEELLNEAKAVSGAKTKKETIEKALKEFIRKRKSMKLLDLEGKIELSYTAGNLIHKRRKDVPHR